VPSLKYNHDIITESAIVAQFLVDSHPSHLVKSSSEPGGPIQRARINFFVDAFFSKVNPLFHKALWNANAEDNGSALQAFVDAVVKEIEPLLEDAGPFFGGSERLTLAEVWNSDTSSTGEILSNKQVLTGSFLLRILSFPKYGGPLPLSILTDFETKAPRFWKWANAVVKENSVNYIYDEERVAKKTLERIAQNNAAKK